MPQTAAAGNLLACPVSVNMRVNGCLLREGSVRIVPKLCAGVELFVMSKVLCALF